MVSITTGDILEPLRETFARDTVSVPDMTSDTEAFWGLTCMGHLSCDTVLWYFVKGTIFGRVKETFLGYLKHGPWRSGQMLIWGGVGGDKVVIWGRTC